MHLRPFAVLLLLAGCATPVSSPPAGTTAPQPMMNSTLEPYELIAPAARTAFLAALVRIDPGLAIDPHRQLRRAVSSCYELYAGKSVAVRLKNVGLRYAEPKKAKRIYPVLFSRICSSKALRFHYDGMAAARRH